MEGLEGGGGVREVLVGGVRGIGRVSGGVRGGVWGGVSGGLRGGV